MYHSCQPFTNFKTLQRCFTLRKQSSTKGELGDSEEREISIAMSSGEHAELKWRLWTFIQGKANEISYKQ